MQGLLFGGLNRPHRSQDRPNKPSTGVGGGEATLSAIRGCLVRDSYKGDHSVGAHEPEDPEEEREEALVHLRAGR